MSLRTINYDLSPITSVAMPIRPTNALIDTGAVGLRSETFGSGETSTEVLARTIAENGNLTTLVQTFINPKLVGDIIRAALPSRSAKVRVRDPLITQYQLQDSVGKMIGATDPKNPIASVIADILAMLMAPLSVIRPITGIVKVNRRMHYLPTIDDLFYEMRTQYIMQILNSTKMQIDWGRMREISLAVLDATLTPVLHRLATSFAGATQYDNYLSDSLALVAQYMMVDVGLFSSDPKVPAFEKNVPAELQRDPNLAALASNFTFAHLAVSSKFASGHALLGTAVEGLAPDGTPADRENAPWTFRSPFHHLDRPLAETVKMIRESKRYKEVSLIEFASMFDLRQIRRSNEEIVGAIVAKNIKPEARTQVTSFLTVDNKPSGYTQVAHPIAEAQFDSIVGGVSATLAMPAMIPHLERVYSMLAEGQETPRVMTLMVSDMEMAHLAAAKADEIIFTRDVNTAQPVIRYGASLNNRHYHTQSAAQNGVLLASDPAEVLILCGSEPATLVAPTHIQTIPDDDRRKVLQVGQLADISEKISKLMKLNIPGGESIITIETTLPELLGLSNALPLYVTKQPVNEMVMTAMVQAARDLAQLLAYAETDTMIKANAQYHMIQICQYISAALTPVFSSATSKGLVRTLYYKALSQGLVVPERDRVRLDLTHTQRRMAMRVMVGLAFLMKLGWLSETDSNYVLSIFEQTEYFKLLATVVEPEQAF